MHLVKWDTRSASITLAYKESIVPSARHREACVHGGRRWHGIGTYNPKGVRVTVGENPAGNSYKRGKRMDTAKSLNPRAEPIWDSDKLVPPEPRPSIFLFQDTPPSNVITALKFVMAESMLGLKGRLFYDQNEDLLVSYMKPANGSLPTLDDVAEIWVANRATEGES